MRTSDVSSDDAGEGAETISNLRLAVLFIGQTYCCVSWVIGVLTPSATVTAFPNTHYTHTITKSVVQTLLHLVKYRSWFSLLMLFTFSVAVPIFKMIGMIKLIMQMLCSPLQSVLDSNRHLILILTYVASYQMLDIYVAVLFVSFFNSDTCEAHVLPGFYWFFSYCCVSLTVSVVLEGALPDGFMGIRGSQRDNYRFVPEMSKEAEVQALSRRRTHPASVLIASIGVICGSLLSLWHPFLEVRTLFHEVTVDRKALSLLKISADMPEFLHWSVIVVVLFLSVVIPLLYISVTLVESLSSRDDADSESSTISDMLRPWVTTDVCALGSFIFMFSLQDDKTQTTVPPGSNSFFVFLGAGALVFFLRWLPTDVNAHTRSFWTAPRKLAFIIVLWSILCGLLSGHVPGVVPQVKFMNLTQICETAKPMTHKAVKDVPGTYGDCNDVASNPPQPCFGNRSLYEKSEGDGFVHAKWISGFDTIKFDGCGLTKVIQGNSLAPSTYVLTVNGHFDDLNMFLHLKECRPLIGCTAVNSADHCCGSNLSFSFDFKLECGMRSHDRGRKELETMRLTRAQIAPMIVEVDFMGGAMKVGVLDVAPTIEETAKAQLNSYIPKARLTWGPRTLSLAQLLDQLIHLNSPEDACAGY